MTRDCVAGLFDCAQVAAAFAAIPSPAAAYILLFLFLFFFTFASLYMAIAAIRKSNYFRVFVIVCALTTGYALLTTGHDTVHHVLRIEALAAQLRDGASSPLIENKVTGEVVPIFLYYSIAPYIIPLAFKLVGFSANVALQSTLVLTFVIFCFSIHWLIERIAPKDVRPLAYLAAVMFICANYVFSLWLTRAALAELSAYALVPLAIRFALDDKSKLALTFILFLQACAHPIVFAYSALGAFVAAYTISERSWVAQARIFLLPCVAAIALSAPFWGPPALHMADVLGISGLPARFGDSFQPPWRLLNPGSITTVGPVLLTLCAVLAFVGWRRRDLKLVVASATFFALLLAQTTLLTGLIGKIPVLDQTQFIWRLMFPTAVIGFAIVLASVIRAHAPFPRTLAWFCALAVLTLTLKLTIGMVRSVGDAEEIVTARQPSADLYFVTFGDDKLSAWGVRLFSPDYLRLETYCPEPSAGSFENVTFGELRKGYPSPASYIGLRGAPIGSVVYTVNGAKITPEHCDKTLVIGPLHRGDVAAVDESWLTEVQYSRYAVLAIFSLVVAGARLRPRRRPA